MSGVEGVWGPVPDRAWPSWVQARMALFGRQWSSFQVCGATGLCVGAGMATVLARSVGLSPAVVSVLLLAGALTFLTLAMATKIVTGRESLVYYHHEVAILAVSWGVLSASGQPVLPYLDLTALGLGTFLAFGRWGCLLVGCCYGRPCRWGVRYGEEHAVEGFPCCYVGARLLPVQALESAFVLLAVIVGATQFLQGRPAGTVLSWYVVGYSAARFGFEELRGDATRPYWWGFSEAQWTSLLLASSVVLAETRGRLPFTWWHGAVAGGIVVAMVVLTSGRRSRAAMLRPGHVSELAAVLRWDRGATGRIEVRRTSLAIGLSVERFEENGDCTVLYSLSRSSHPLTEREAGVLARVILDLDPLGSPQHRLLRGQHHVFHLVTRGRWAS